MKPISLFRKIKKHFGKHKPLITVTLSKSALLHNLYTFKNTYPEMRIAPVLKSNAYGHGLGQVADMLDAEKLPFFVLDSYFEAHTLRKHGVQSDLLVIGYTPTDTLLRARVRCTYTITSLDQLRELGTKLTRRLCIHVKFDTGMHRQGLMPHELKDALEVLRGNHHLVLEGICTHLADADSLNTDFTEKQLSVWETIVREMTYAFPQIRHIHVSATAGARFSDSKYGNVIRLGLGLYGIDPSPEKLDLRPVLQMESAVSSLRTLSVGESVGYNHTFTARKPCTVATVPVGYFEGVDRRLSNRGAYTIDGVVCPLLGRVSMNITSVDVSNVPSIKCGTPVIVLSRNASDKNSVEQVAKEIGAIPWEVLVRIPEHLSRKVIE